MRSPALFAALFVLGAAAVVLAKNTPPLKEALEDHLVSSAWIYDDIDAGYAEAKKTGKPLLVTFRCVP
jgi:hypothetical protein